MNREVDGSGLLVDGPEHADLSHADLSHADLSHADLSHVDLETTLVTRALYDEVFRLRLLTDPKGTIERETGLRLPPDMRVTVHQETPSQRHLVIPAAPNLED